MSKKEIPLSAILRKSEESITIDSAETYRQVTVKLWGKGVTQRGVVSGAEIAASRQNVVREGQLIVSRIDARNGAIGIVPSELDGALVSNDFPTFDINRDLVIPEYLGWFCRTDSFVDECRHASEGTTNRVRLKEDRFLDRKVRVPELLQQQEVVGFLSKLSTEIEKVQLATQEQGALLQSLLSAKFNELCMEAPARPMRDVAPIVRRPVSVDLEAIYPELGIRSFGKGTFHKPGLSGAEIAGKRIFEIAPGDLLFSNVFAWEGAIAVARPEDAGRYGSHRYITCVPRPGVALAKFLLFYFLTPEGLERIGRASPGGAGRNRTLGVAALEALGVPLPDLSRQEEFVGLMERMESLLRHQADLMEDVSKLKESVLNRIFRDDA